MASITDQTEAKLKRLVIANYKSLCESLDYEKVVFELQARGVLSFDDVDRINSYPDYKQRKMILFNKIQKTKGAYIHFVEILRDTGHTGALSLLQFEDEFRVQQTTHNYTQPPCSSSPLQVTPCRRGLLLIINNNNYSSNTSVEQDACEQDAVRLRELEEFGFAVVEHKNCTKSDIESILLGLNNTTRDSEALIVVFLGHGDADVFCSVDEIPVRICISSIIDLFRNDKLRTLKGRTKILLFNLYRPGYVEDTVADGARCNLLEHQSHVFDSSSRLLVADGSSSSPRQSDFGSLIRREPAFSELLVYFLHVNIESNEGSPFFLHLTNFIREMHVFDFFEIIRTSKEYLCSTQSLFDAHSKSYGKTKPLFISRQ